MSEYILIDALNSDPAGPFEVAYSLGAGPSYSPVQMDDVMSGGLQATNAAAADFGPFLYGSALYATLTVGDSRGTIIRKSTDNGATWATQDDTAGVVYAAFFDGAHTLIAAYLTTGIGAGELRLRNYDLATGLWGTVYGITTAPSGIAVAVYTVWQRPDSSVLVLFRRRNAFPGDGSSGIDAAVWSGASWSEFDAGANILALSGWDASHTIVQANLNTSYMEAGGRIGLCFSTTSSAGGPPYWGGRVFFQQINLDNSLGSFFDFPGQSTVISGRQDLEIFSGAPFGRPVLLPDQNLVVLPVMMANRHAVSPNQVICLYIGTPISAPVWSVDDTKYLDPLIPSDDTVWPMEWGDAAFDGETLWVVYVSSGSDYSTLGRVRLCKTANLASPADGWTAVTVLDIPTAPGWFQVTSQQIFTPSIFVPAVAAFGNTFE